MRQKRFSFKLQHVEQPTVFPVLTAEMADFLHDQYTKAGYVAFVRDIDDPKSEFNGRPGVFVHPKAN